MFAPDFSKQLSKERLKGRKALDNIDLNPMSHRYVCGVLQNDWNDTSTSAHLIDRSEDAKIWVSLSYKTVNIVVSSLYYLKNVKSVIDSAVLYWTTRLKVFPRNVGFGRCYLVLTRHEVLSNIYRNAEPNRNSAVARKKS